MSADQKERPMKVWVIETGEYAERMVLGVAASEAAAVEYVKARYQTPPYKVEWTEHAGYLVGEFDAVFQYSTKHDAVYDFTEYEVGT